MGTLVIFNSMVVTNFLDTIEKAEGSYAPADTNHRSALRQGDTRVPRRTAGSVVRHALVTLLFMWVSGCGVDDPAHAEV